MVRKIGDGPWTEVGDNASANDGDVKVVEKVDQLGFCGDGDFCVEFKASSTAGTPSIYREVDMSNVVAGVITWTLSFDRYIDMDNDDAEVQVQYRCDSVRVGAISARPAPSIGRCVTARTSKSDSSRKSCLVTRTIHRFVSLIPARQTRNSILTMSTSVGKTRGRQTARRLRNTSDRETIRSCLPTAPFR